MAGNVGKKAERAGDHHRGHDREPVEPIGEIHGVARADDHEEGHADEADRSQRIRHLLEERNDELGLRRNMRGERDVARGGETEHRLPEEFDVRIDNPLGLRRTTFR